MSQSGVSMKGVWRKTLGVWVLMLVVHLLFGYILQNPVVEQMTGGNVAVQIRGHPVQLTQYYGVLRPYVVVCDAQDSLKSDVWQYPLKGEVCSKAEYENVYMFVYVGEMLYIETAQKSVGLMPFCIRSFQEPLTGVSGRVWLENGRSRGTADDMDQGGGGRFAQGAGLHHFSEGGGCHRSGKSECCPHGSTALKSIVSDVVVYKIMHNGRGKVAALYVIWGASIHGKQCCGEFQLQCRTGIILTIRAVCVIWSFNAYTCVNSLHVSKWCNVYVMRMTTNWFPHELHMFVMVRDVLTFCERGQPMLQLLESVEPK